MSRWVYSVHGPFWVWLLSDKERAVWDAREAYLQDLFDSGVVLMSGPIEGQPLGGIAVFDAADEREAKRIMLGDPAVAHGVGIGHVHRSTDIFRRVRPTDSSSQPRKWSISPRTGQTDRPTKEEAWVSSPRPS